MKSGKQHPPPGAQAEEPAAGIAGVSGFPIVGVGASAGGLEAFTQMLGALPVDTGMGFVLVQHLAPSHPSFLSEILSRATAMPVREVGDEPRVEPNHVYVIPPDRSMTISGGVLQLLPRPKRGRHLPIDHFLSSLAKDRGDRAIGVVLSGTGADGTVGLGEIKAEGGITFAQDDTARQGSMPHSAVATGCVDFVLPPAEIAGELARIARHPYVAGAPAGKPEAPPGLELTEVLRLLRSTTGTDFAQYKPNTLNRRVARRMVLHKVEGLDDYARLLRESPKEMEALYQDILIKVTRFFRDPEMFAALQAEVLPKLFAEGSRREPLRVWVLGCSTGEEAYSLAIVLTELAEARGGELPVQIFATDVNGAVIEKARAGLYSTEIVNDVSPERLRRFFAEVDGHYRVAKRIRDLCVFARHNVATDPPFSRIDLLSCRNLLIYLEPALQKRVVPLLHYALRPAGFLVLGSSETVGSYRDLFELEDARHKIFSRKPGLTRLPFDVAAQKGADPGPGPRPERPRESAAEVQREADRILLARYAPAGVVVDAAFEILQFRGDTSPYLAPAPGKASLSLLRMAREGLAGALRAALAKAGKEAAPVREQGVRVQSGGGFREVHLEVIPIKGGRAREGGFLVLFEEAAAAALPALPRKPGKRGTTGLEAVTPLRRATDETAERQNARLAQELAATREYLQSVIEQQEAANEELQSANEEAQSANEELQSINEELETAKEEIQSSNEELATVNDELQNRNLELSRTTADLINLLDSAEMPVVMLGQDLCIRRFTPAAGTIFHLMPADLGRPIGDLRLGIDLSDLGSLLAEVIDTASVREREVQDRKGCWYLLRVRPYRTLDNKVEGAVMMLVDIDSLKRAHALVESVVQTVREPLLVLGADLRVRTASRSFYQTFGTVPAETEGRRLHEVGGPWNDPELRRLLQEVLSRGEAFAGFEVESELGDLDRRTLLLNARRLIQQDGESPLMLLAIEDVTERKQLENALRQRAEDLAANDRSKNEFLALLAHELRNPLAPLRNAVHVLGAPGATEADVERARAMMSRQIHNMGRLIEDLLDVSRISRGTDLLRRETVELATVLTQAVELTAHRFEAGRQELALSLPPSPVYLDADPTRLEQVFGNLLTNASKFTPDGGHVWLTAEPPAAGEVVVRVRDDGIGIAPETLPQVFDLFMQADRSIDRSRGGLGIGLTLVRRLVELHGGGIEAASAGLGQGSEFVVRLPVSPQAAAELHGTAAGAAPAPRRVLVVDDSEDTAESMALLLRLRGHRVALAHSGPAALEVADAFQPEIVLLDIGLPGLDGHEVARRLRQDPRLAKTTLVALTGYGQEEDRRLALEAGFDHHLVKPVDPQVVYDLLARPLPASAGG